MRPDKLTPIEIRASIEVVSTAWKLGEDDQFLSGEFRFKDFALAKKIDQISFDSPLILG